jgi:hypothetical protein
VQGFQIIHILSPRSHHGYSTIRPIVKRRLAVQHRKNLFQVPVARIKQLASHRLFLQIFASQRLRKYFKEARTLESALNNGNLDEIRKYQAIALCCWQYGFFGSLKKKVCIDWENLINF